MKRITLIICFLYSICFFLPKNEAYCGVNSGICLNYICLANCSGESECNENQSVKEKESLVNSLPEALLDVSTWIQSLNGIITNENEKKELRFGSVVFNEIMANPSGVEALPESEYIELFNRTDSLIVLRNSALFYGGKRYLLPPVSIEAKSYAVLCHQKYKEQWELLGVSVIGVNSFPALLNTGKLLWLEDEKGGLLSWVEYSDSWYKDSNKKGGGFSLECLDPDNLSNDAANWCASSDTKGGTPGAQNSVMKSFPDNREMALLSTNAIAPDTMMICFNKPMSLKPLSDLRNYHIDDSDLSLTKVIPDYPCGKNVKLALSGALNTGETLRLTLTNLSDVSGNKQNKEIKTELFIPDQLAKNDLLFNEILFNPRSGGACYVEISNVSGKSFSCGQLFLSVLKKDGTRSTPVALGKSEKLFSPQIELFFTKNVSAVASQYSCEPSSGVETADFPVLSVEKGTLYLLSDKGVLIDEMVYSDLMHTTSAKDKKGISLEKKAPGLSSLDAGNWSSASYNSGYGTPGLPNQCTEQAENELKPRFWIEKNTISPNNSDNNTLQIHYRLTEEGYVVNTRIYDAFGREVFALPLMSGLPAEGVIEWNGKERDGTVCRIGIYIAYVEIHNAKGYLKKYKLPFALTR